MKRIFVFIIFSLVVTVSLYAQKKDSISHLLQLPIESLMDIPIYSASKSPESTFEAPLSSSVITKELIKRAGCTSIMEALRLVRGILVREQTNGNYDIHIRGLDNVPPNASLIFFTSSTTLVMIDNCPVYNYLHGGTFWETLPVDLNDVEKIEVVRGPSAALYGPNAVSGVINIITRKPEKQGIYTVANARYGSYNSLLGNASVGYRFNDKISAVISGNYQNRNRTQLTYYDVVQNSYVPLDSVTAIKANPVPNTGDRYPHRRLAMRKYAANAFVNYTPGKNVQLSMDVGAQHSEVQKAFGADTYAALLTTATSEIKYVNLKGSLHDAVFQLSYQNGTQSPVAGATIWRWNYNTLDAIVEYNFNRIPHLTLTPGIMYRRAVYDDSKYVNVSIKEGFWSGRAESITRALSLRADYKLLNDRLRLVGGTRIDKFNQPEKTYVSWQLAATYTINDHNLVRVVQSRAYRTPLILDLYSNLNLTGRLNASQTYLLEIRGNKNIRLLTSNMFEAGYRSKIKDNIELDAEFFYTKTSNFSFTIFESGVFDSTSSLGFYGLLDFNNLAMYTKQWGASVAFHFIAGKWQFRPFVTVQKTTLYDYSIYANSPNAPPIASNNFNPAQNNIYSGKGTKMNHRATPACYGGAYINWNPVSKLNINMNPWFFSSYTQLHSANLTYKDGVRGVEKVKGKLMVNAAVSWIATKNITLQATVRNCFNNRAREFYKADAPALMVFGGINYEL